jgi:hypothetical protein
VDRLCGGPTADAAIEAAAVVFESDVRRLIAVRRREIAWGFSFHDSLYGK